jgi:hypothetical protein
MTFPASTRRLPTRVHRQRHNNPCGARASSIDDSALASITGGAAPPWARRAKDRCSRLVADVTMWPPAQGGTYCVPRLGPAWHPRL